MSVNLDERTARIKQRQQAFFDALPQALRDDEDAIPTAIRAMNASSRSKLQRIYSLADALMVHREPFTACKKGCAGCCHMNIAISADEAARIATATGRQANPLKQSKRHHQDTFAGEPCPFLGADSACSIYMNRPLVCRNHASFDEDAALCDPSVMNNVKVQLVKYAGIDEAFIALTQSSRNPVVADIRDFFPKR